MDYYKFSIQNASVSGHVQKIQITVTLTGNLNDNVVCVFNSTLCDEEVLGNGGIGPQILTSIQDGAACPDSFTLGETATGTNWIEIKTKK